MNDIAAPQDVGQLDRRDIPGLEGLYAATYDGRILSLRRGRYLTPALVRGYPGVSISVNGKTTMRKVHRLVAIAWIPNPQGLPQVNHIDGRKDNNRVDNLEWSDSRLQQIHARALGLVTVTERMRAASSRNIRKANHSARALTAEQAAEVRSSRESLAAAARRLGVHKNTIAQIRQGKSYVD